jgi:hypothetical protein
MSYLREHTDAMYRFAERTSKRYENPTEAKYFLEMICGRIADLSRTPTHNQISHLKNVVRISEKYIGPAKVDALNILYKTITIDISSSRLPKLNFYQVLLKMDKDQEQFGNVPPLGKLEMIAKEILIKRM